MYITYLPIILLWLHKEAGWTINSYMHNKGYFVLYVLITKRNNCLNVMTPRCAYWNEYTLQYMQ